jgi:predicted TIM-barrel fold metal-dependent hydrolase
MHMNEMILISTDDHLVEPADLFEQHIDRRFLDVAPKVMTNDRGEQRWTVEGKVLGVVGAAAVAGRARDELHFEPANYDQIRQGTYDVHARIDDMNANGVLTSTNFATMAGFSGEAFLVGRDKALMHAIVRAYNDWHLQSWCAAYPGRFIPVCFLPLWDCDLAVAEVKRVARMGAKAICFPENPASLGLPSFHDDSWDPLFRACCDANLVVAIHIGTGGGFRYPSDDSPVSVAIATMNITLADAAADILFSPVLIKFPDLKFALSEGYLGWVPFFKERVDYVHEMHGQWSPHDFGTQKPSEVFRRHFLLCFTEDPVGIKLRHELGMEAITWECDYPHADSTWPRSPERLWRSISTLPREEIDAITHQNAMKWFDFDPFAHIAREHATVGHLRGKATHVNVSPKAGLGGFRPGTERSKAKVTARDLKTMAQLMVEG